MSNYETSSSGIGFLDLLTIVFIVLKLTGAISWSWWWVLCPLWLPVVVVITIFCFAMFVDLLMKPER